MRFLIWYRVHLCILFQIGICLSKCEGVPLDDVTNIFSVLRCIVCVVRAFERLLDTNHIVISAQISSEDRELLRAPFLKKEATNYWPILSPGPH